MNPSWSPQQREALEAMGLPVYRMAGASAPADAPAAMRGESNAAASAFDPLMRRPLQ